MIDKVLSRFKIKTKVVLFVLPFVISISAVGLTGLYASGMLQSRMEISNNVLQSLTGFKELYGSLDAFLKDTTEANRDKVHTDLSDQADVLSATRSRIGAEGVGAGTLDEAVQHVNVVDGIVQKLWTLKTQQNDTTAAIDAVRQEVTSRRIAVTMAVNEMDQSIRSDEGKAKDVLRDADNLWKGGDYLSTFGGDFRNVFNPDAKLKLVSERMADLRRYKRSIAASLPPTKKNLGESLDATIKGLETALAAKDKTIEEQATEVGTLVSRFMQTSSQLQLVAQIKAREATRIFGSMDQRVLTAQSILGDTRQLVEAVYTLESAAGRFLGDRSSDNLNQLKNTAGDVTNAIAVLGGNASNLEFYHDLSVTTMPQVANLKKLADQLVAIDAEREEQFKASRVEIDAIWNGLTAFAELQKQTAGSERQEANGISILATTLGIILAISGGIALVLTLQRPIGQITGAMRRLAEGRLDTSISGEARGDEIGDMARALGIFKENALAKIRIEAEGEQQRSEADDERRRNDAEKQEVDRQITFAVDQLAAGLGRLAQGDISTTIDTPFTGRLERLRQDFNQSLSRLQSTISRITDNVRMIQGNGNQMAYSAEDLSKRTEQQAASLEETAAAVEEITVTVRSSAERAREADAIVRDTKRSADNSAVVVGDAIQAMQRIEDASRHIEQIIDVIDEIAFQTNLLALNAGIEAARAGEAGKGFAVVAQEVRELAQRSASAAQEIKSLIDKSSAEVSGGARLVQQTGEVLTRIGQQIATISQHVETISTAAQDQSRALAEVNGSVNQMDQMTQKNAAMVEETTAASRELANEADALLALVSQFKLGTTAKAYAARAA